MGTLYTSGNDVVSRHVCRLTRKVRNMHGRNFTNFFVAFTKGGESSLKWMLEGGGRLSLATHKLKAVVIGVHIKLGECCHHCMAINKGRGQEQNVRVHGSEILELF